MAQNQRSTCKIQVMPCWICHNNKIKSRHLIPSENTIQFVYKSFYIMFLICTLALAKCFQQRAEQQQQKMSSHHEFVFYFYSHFNYWIFVCPFNWTLKKNVLIEILELSCWVGKRNVTLTATLITFDKFTQNGIF